MSKGKDRGEGEGGKGRRNTHQGLIVDLSL